MFEFFVDHIGDAILIVCLVCLIFLSYYDDSSDYMRKKDQ